MDEEVLSLLNLSDTIIIIFLRGSGNILYMVIDKEIKQTITSIENQEDLHNKLDSVTTYIGRKDPVYKLRVYFWGRYRDRTWFLFKVYQTPDEDERFILQFEDRNEYKYFIRSKPGIATEIEGLITSNLGESEIDSVDEQINKINLQPDVYDKL